MLRQALQGLCACGIEPGSPFGPNLRALVISLRFTQGVAFERLSRLMTDLFGLSISEGALVNSLSAARQRLAAESAALRAKLLRGTVICSDENRPCGSASQAGGCGFSITAKMPFS